jgi:hypothetical protein
MKKLFGGSPYTKFIATATAFIWTIAIGNSAGAAQLEEARVTQVVNDVKLLLEQGAPRPAAVTDLIRRGNAVRTGTQSRSELTFADLTITRLGANTIFSFKEGTREMNLIDGAILFQVPKGSGGATIRTVGVTAAITGTTGIGEFHPATSSRPQPFSKWLCLEGTFHLYLPNGQSVEVGPGKMVTTDGKSFSKVLTFDIAKLVTTSLFFTGFDQPLASMNLIMLESQNQLVSGVLATTTTNPLDPSKIVNVTSQAVVAEEAQAPPSSSVSPPPPTPPPTTPPPPTSTPSKFGTPSVISSPVPYLITNGTVITTDPSITTNGVTDYGKIYRGQTDDGAFSLWAFGSTSAFDTALNIDTDFFANANHLPIAAFKFQSLSLTGDPTIDTSNNGVTKLALIGVDGITSGPPGGTLTFTGLDLLALATVNGSINLTSDVSFQDLNELAMYARGAGSDLTINSPISNIGILYLAAEGSIQLTNPGTMRVGGFESTAGNNLTLQIGGSLLLDGNTNLNTLVLPGTTVASGANLTLNIGSDLTNSSTTDFSRLRVMNEGAHIGTGGNISVNIGGDLTTSGPTGGFPGDFALEIKNTNGQIDNGGNITLTAGGSISTHGQLGLLVENYDFSTSPAGQIGTGGNISVTTAGNLTSDSISAVINNQNGGTIGSAVNLTFNIAGALTTVQNGTDYFGDPASLSLTITNRYDNTFGSTIGGDATLDFHADSASIGGNLNTFLSDRGGTINGNAFLNFNITHDINVSGMDTTTSAAAEIELLNDSGPPGGAATPLGGTIHGDATLQVNTANLTLTAGSLDVEILNQNGGVSGPGGTIDSSANITFNLSGNLTTQTDASFAIRNNYAASGPGGIGGIGGTIGQDAVLNINADSLSIGGTLDTSIHNGRNAGDNGGTIGGNATINLVVVGGITALDDSQLIGNGGGTIGLNAAITVSAASLTTTDTAPGALSASINNNAGGIIIGGNASINFDLSGNLTSASDANFLIDNSGGGTIGGSANVSLNATGNVTVSGANGITLQISNEGGSIAGGMPGDGVSYTVGGTTSTPSLELYVDNSNGGVINTGGNVTLNTTGPVMMNGPLGLEIDNFNGGSITNGANVMAHFVGDVTDTTGQFHSLNFFVLNGAGFFSSDVTGGTIGTGGNINVTFDGNAETTPTSTTGSFAAIIANGGGTIGTGGNISLTVGGLVVAGGQGFNVDIENQGGQITNGGNVTVQVAGDVTSSTGAFFGVLNNGGSIGSGTNVTVNVGGNLTTQADAAFQILNNDDGSGSGPGTIGSDATLNVSAANISTGGNLDAEIDNFSGGMIGGNAAINVAAGGDINAQGNAAFGISNSDFSSGSGGGVIVGDAMVNVSATSITAGALFATITNLNSSIGGNATVDVLAPSGIISGGDAAFSIYNADNGSGAPAGMIGNNATVNVSAGDVSIAGSLENAIYNKFVQSSAAGSIGGDASLTFDAGAITVQDGASFKIDSNNGGQIGGNAIINLSATSLSVDGALGLLVHIINFNGGTIGQNALIDFGIAGDVSVPSDATFQILNNNTGTGFGSATIIGNATINVNAANVTAGSLLTQIVNNGGTIGGDATINMNLSGTATVTNDATVQILGSDGAASAAINLNGGNYNAGGTFLSYIDGNGTITFNNASAHADVLKAGVFGANGALNISGGTLSADSELKLYAPGSNGQLNFMSNVTLGGNSLKTLAANSITIFNNVVVTIGGAKAADVYVNFVDGVPNANYTGFGGNGATTGTFDGAGANKPQPLSSAPPFGPLPPAPIHTRTGIHPPPPVATGVINVSSSDELLALLDDVHPGRDGRIRIPASERGSHGRNASRINSAAYLNAVRRAEHIQTASASAMRRLQ